MITIAIFAAIGFILAFIMAYPDIADAVQTKDFTYIVGIVFAIICFSLLGALVGFIVSVLIHLFSTIGCGHWACFSH